eukprot:m.135242 g.135242  ORF g.135242 m.135242 type:complete len:133 (-) comp9883_c0_seq2:3172-3570(-)
MNIFCPTLRRVRDFSEKIFICLPGFVLGHGQPHKPDLRTMFDDTEEDEDTPAFFSIQEYSDLLASAEAQLQDLDMCGSGGLSLGVASGPDCLPPSCAGHLIVPSSRTSQLHLHNHQYCTFDLVASRPKLPQL